MLGMTEWLILGGIVTLLFGAKQLPKLARSIGTAKREFQQASTAPLNETESKDGPTQ